MPDDTPSPRPVPRLRPHTDLLEKDEDGFLKYYPNAVSAADTGGTTFADGYDRWIKGAVPPGQILPAGDAAADEYLYRFERVENLWFLRFENENGTYENLKGFKRYARILENPNPAKALNALDVAAVDSRIPRQQSDDDVVEEEVRKKKLEFLEIQQRLDELDDDHAGDTMERQQLLQRRKELAVWGEGNFVPTKKGEYRKLDTGNSVKKAHDAIEKTLTKVRETIAKKMPRLAEHLERYVKPEGHNFAYRPPTPPTWKITYC
jgi:hypothetical protein